MFMMCSILLSLKIGAQAEGAAGWRIMRAQYGWRGRQTDVTDLLQDLIGRGGGERASSGEVIANNRSLGGDPAPRADKVLIVI